VPCAAPDFQTPARPAPEDRSPQRGRRNAGHRLEVVNEDRTGLARVVLAGDTATVDQGLG
jgi:hypothetical protein